MAFAPWVEPLTFGDSRHKRRPILMGWGFRVTCPDCRYEWEGIETMYLLGPWSMVRDPAITHVLRAWFCPRCYSHLYVPRCLERDIWKGWYAAFLAGPGAVYPFLRNVAERLDDALSAGRNSTELEAVDCPRCRQPLEE